MPAIMPPINPNIIAALGQYFGGMQNRTIRTPPFIRPGSTAQRGEVLGRPGMPTPGMPQTMPSGSAAPTAPGVAPPPRSLGDQLANIPRQPELTPTPRAAAAPATPPPNYQLDPNELPEGFSEIKDASDGSRRLVDADGNEYVYNASGRQISGPPPPAAAAAPATAPSAEPPEEDTPRSATDRSMKVYQNPLGGRTEEDTDGTRYVYDKNGKLVNRINPPGGSPVTGTQPDVGAKAPASMPQQKRGVWSTLTDPSLAGIALAAGQQLTRPRYPGETATGNAVSAVTAGYNTLAQQRQMQYAREQAQREWEAKQAKAQQDKLESEARIGGIKSESDRRAAQSKNDEKQRELEAARDKETQTQNRVKEVENQAKLNLDISKARTEQERADALKNYYEGQIETSRQAQATAWANAETRRKEYREAVRHNESQENLDKRKIAVDEAELGLKRAKDGVEKAGELAKLQNQARLNVMAADQIANNPNNPNRGKQPAGPPSTPAQKIVMETERLWQEQQQIKGRTPGAAAPSTQAAPVQGQPQVAADDKGNVWDLRNGQWVLRPR